MGTKDHSDEKGMFPANFTRPLWSVKRNFSKLFHPSSSSNNNS